MQLLQKLLGIKFDRKKKQKILYLFFWFKIFMIHAASWVVFARDDGSEGG